MAGKKGKRVWALFGLIVVFGIVGGLAWIGPVAMTLFKTGFFDPEVKFEYSATSEENLRRLHTALMLYHDSEGQFPKAGGWMDAIENRLQTNDLKAGEGSKKLHNPFLKPEEYGYAFNSSASGKYSEDLTEKGRTILVFDSQSTSRNASGDPSVNQANPPRKGGNLAIRVDGTLVRNGKDVAKKAR